jgi:hypothetical protein
MVKLRSSTEKNRLEHFTSWCFHFSQAQFWEGIWQKKPQNCLESVLYNIATCDKPHYVLRNLKELLWRCACHRLNNGPLTAVVTSPDLQFTHLCVTGPYSNSLQLNYRLARPSSAITYRITYILDHICSKCDNSCNLLCFRMLCWPIHHVKPYILNTKLDCLKICLGFYWEILQTVRAG